MVNPITRFTNKPAITALPWVFGGFESLIHTYMPDDLNALWGGEENFAIKSVVDFNGVFGVFQVSEKYRESMTGGLEMSEWLKYLETLDKAKTLEGDISQELILKSCYADVRKVIDHITGTDLSGFEYSLVKLGRRKSTTYVATLISKADPKQGSVIVFTGTRKSSRIAMFNDLLSLSLRTNGTPNMNQYQVSPSQW